MKGFLHIQCPQCGRARSVFAKEPITEFRCRCGNAVPLPERMTRAFVSCPSCEREVRYLTNRTDEGFTLRCFACSAPVDLEYNVRKGLYETL